LRQARGTNTVHGPIVTVSSRADDENDFSSALAIEEAGFIVSADNGFRYPLFGR